MKRWSNIPDAVLGDMRWGKAQGENEARRNFIRFKEAYPHIRYEDVLVVTECALRVRGGKIYRLGVTD